MNLVTIDTSPGNVSLYIAPNNTKYLEIGTNASTVNIGNANCSTTINGPLVMGTGKNITLQPTTGYVAPSALTQLGGLVEVLIGSDLSFTTSAANFLIASVTIGTPGIYIINYSFRYQKGDSTTSLTFIQSWISTTTQSLAATQYGNSAVSFIPAQTAFEPICQNGIAIVNITSSTTFRLYGFAKYTGTAPILFASNSMYSYVRIA